MRFSRTEYINRPRCVEVGMMKPLDGAWQTTTLIAAFSSDRSGSSIDLRSSSVHIAIFASHQRWAFFHTRAHQDTAEHSRTQQYRDTRYSEARRATASGNKTQTDCHEEYAIYTLSQGISRRGICKHRSPSQSICARISTANVLQLTLLQHCNTESMWSLATSYLVGQHKLLPHSCRWTTGKKNETHNIANQIVVWYRNHSFDVLLDDIFQSTYPIWASWKQPATVWRAVERVGIVITELSVRVSVGHLKPIY